MKQIVELEQIKQLNSAGIFIDCERTYYGCGKDNYRAPTIGELIEWIKDNMPRGWRNAIKMALCKDGELIDALVELAIKIALNGQEVSK